MEALIRTGEDFGRAIAEVRRSKQLTQAEMADEIGVTRSYLSQLEHGRTTRLLDHYLRVLRHAGARVIVSFDDDQD